MHRRFDTPLSELTTLGLGGPAAELRILETQAELVDCVQTFGSPREEGPPLLLLAGGSNVVIADEGWPGIVGLVRTRGRRIMQLPQ